MLKYPLELKTSVPPVFLLYSHITTILTILLTLYKYTHTHTSQTIYIYMCVCVVCVCVCMCVFFIAILWYKDIPRLGVKSELQLQAYSTTTAMPSCICNLHHSLWQHQVLNPLSKARD